MRISAKLMLATFALLLGPLLGLSWTSYRNSREIVSKNQRDLVYNMLDGSERTLTAFQDQVSTLLLSVAADSRLWAASDDQAEDILQTYARYNTNVSTLYLVRNEGKAIGVPRWLVRSVGRQAVPLVQQFAQQQTDGVWWTEPYHSPLSNWTVTAGVRAVLPNGQSPGWVLVDLPLVSLRSVLPPAQFSVPATMLVFSPQQAPIIANDLGSTLRHNLLYNHLSLPAELQSRLKPEGQRLFQTVNINDATFLALSGTPNRWGWRSVILLSNRDLEAATAQVRQTTLNALIWLTLVSLLLAWFVARYFARPLERLAGEMARVRLGQLDGVQVPRRTDEIGQLAGAFNGMMERIRQLIHDLQTTERRKKEAEIQMLQSQIRPHFLYNTLNAIGHAASLGRTNDVYAMIQSLTYQLSFTFDKVSDTVLFAQELEFLDHYMRLQRIRYGNSFQVIYNVAPDVGHCRLLKLLLQPIVENAIFHGLAQRGEGGVLEIHARRAGESLELQVRDNGPGMSAEALHALEQGIPTQHSSHVGLRNIRERLHLHYGDQAALTVASCADRTGASGTTVTIRLPLDCPPKEETPRHVSAPIVHEPAAQVHEMAILHEV